jgi:hypothetical protein
MSWLVEFKESTKEAFEAAEFSNQFRKKVVEYILVRLENDSCMTLKATHIDAPVRCSRWIFCQTDESNITWRFLVMFNETERPGTRFLYYINWRSI